MFDFSYNSSVNFLHAFRLGSFELEGMGKFDANVKHRSYMSNEYFDF